MSAFIKIIASSVPSSILKLPRVISLTIPRLSLAKALLLVTAIELFIGGGSRLIDIGPLSIRMYLFVTGLLISALLVLEMRRMNIDTVVVLSIVTVVLAFSSVLGLLNGAAIGSILNDVKPLLFFYSLLFFSLTIRTMRDVQFVVRILKVCAVLMAVAYLATVIGINLRIISFRKFYAATSVTEEFFFRGEYAFFYKGFIYLCIGAIFYVTSAKVNKFAVTILAVAIILTFTRGFFLAIVLTFFCYHLFIRRSAAKFIGFVIVCAIAIASLWGIYYQDAKDRKMSDSARLLQFVEVADAVSPISALVGHGFGIGIPSRGEHFEIVFLEVFHKQGLIGLACWSSLLIVSWSYFSRARQVDINHLATPFMLSVIFVFIESMSNPFLNNPIGLGIVLISLISLRVIRDMAVETSPPGLTEQS